MAAGSGPKRTSSRPSTLSTAFFITVLGLVPTGMATDKIQVADDVSGFYACVGLEHTGHHLWWAAFPADLLSAHNFSRAILLWSYQSHNHSMMAVATRNMLGARLTSIFYAELANIAETNWARRVSLDSYPQGPADGLGRHPDAPLLADASRAAGATMRFVIMTRAPQEIVRIWSLKRVESLSRQCRIMQAHVKELRWKRFPLFVLPYWRTLELAERVGAFLGSKDVPARLRATWLPTNRSSVAETMMRSSGLAASPAWISLQRCSRELDQLSPGGRGGSVPFVAFERTRELGSGAY